MATDRERKVQTDIINTSKLRGCYVYKNAQNMYTEVGRPDLSVCMPVTLKRLNELFDENKVVGLFVGIEVKRPGRLNGVSDAQKIVGSKIQKKGGIWLLADDVTTVEALFDEYDVKK